MIADFRSLIAIPESEVAMLRQMADIAKNRLRRPKRPSLLVDSQGINTTFVNYAA